MNGKCLLLIVSLALTSASCRSFVQPPQLPPPAVSAPLAATYEPPPTPEWQIVGHSVQGRPIEYCVAGQGDDTVLILSSIHGDEAAATPLAFMLAVRLATSPKWLAGRRVVVVPVVNPDGVATRSRGNARGVDLNRNFPAANFRGRDRNGSDPLSQPESRAIRDLVERFQPTRILSFHQAADQLDYDGPARDLTERMAAVSHLAVERMGARPGSLGSWAGVDLGIPIVTVELPRGADDMTAAELWEAYGDLLVAAIRYPDVVAPGAAR